MNTSKPTSRTVLMKNLEKLYPKMWMKTTEEFNGHKGGIWTGEGSMVKVEPDFDLELFNHYSEDFKETTYVMGVYKPLHEYLEKHGWFSEWQDGGTIMFWKN